MAKRKAEVLTQATSSHGSKKIKHKATDSKPTLFDDSDSSSSEDESDGGAKLAEPAFKVNTEYANRFEHNKKREELAKLEEKFEKSQKPVKGQYGDKYDEDSESSNDEDEDDDGILADEAMEAGMSTILQAIRSKDPILYDETVTFYPPIEEDGGEIASTADAKAKKPMYLRDYHRENLLKGHNGADLEDDHAPKTFVQEQEDLKRNIVREMHAAVDGSDEEDGGFLVPKSKPKPMDQGVHPSRASKMKVEVDVSTADKDPETFLSNFLSARAWVANDGARFQPLEEDDDEADERADAFEAAYNLRFEDPKGSNEVLKSYARDIIAAKSVRREEPSGRRKQRDALKEKKDAERAEREEERARFRRLKIDEMEEKLQKIKKAAGVKGKTLKDEDWTRFLDDGWDDEKWEAEMSKRFGEDYYAEQDVISDSDEESEEVVTKKKKVKKPKWDDDIDIKDLIPEFEEEEEANEKPAFTLSDSENEAEAEDDDENLPSRKRSKTNKDRQVEKQAKKKAARLERKKIEDLVDSKMDLDLPTKSKQPSMFRYRETSPTSFGLTARDILMAPDTALNQFAGLKKIASFRDVEKKRKDKKYLGKKARIREWRKETFGNEDGPEIVFAGAVADQETKDGGDIVEGSRKKKKRSRKSKGGALLETE